MKTKKINVNNESEEVINREYYIEKLIRRKTAEGELIVVIEGGCLNDVINSPNDKYLLIDWDNIEDGDLSEEEFKEEYIDEYNLEDEE